MPRDDINSKFTPRKMDKDVRTWQNNGQQQMILGRITRSAVKKKTLKADYIVCFKHLVPENKNKKRCNK